MLLARAGLLASAGGSAPVNTSLPTTTPAGTATQGQTLNGSLGAWNGNPTPSLTSLWLKDGVSTGNTTLSYLLGPTDVGTSITLRVTGTNSEGSAQATSAAVTVTAAGPTLPILLPTSTGWSAPSTIISQGSAGAWDNWFGGTPVIVCVLRRLNGDLIAYYVGAEDNSGSAGPARRALGVAISTNNGTSWTKHGSTPILTYLPTTPTNPAAPAFGIPGGWAGDEGIWAAAAWLHADNQIYMMVGGLEDNGGENGQVRGNILRTICASGDGVTFSGLTMVISGSDDTWYTGSTDDERFPLSLWHDGALWHMLYGYKKAGAGLWDIGHAWTGTWTSWTAANTEAFLDGDGDGPLEQARQVTVTDRGISGLLDYWLLSRTNANPGDSNVALGSCARVDPGPPSRPPRLHLDPATGTNRTYGLPVYLDRTSSKWFMHTNDGNINQAQQQRTQAVQLGTAPAWPSMVDFIEGNAARYYSATIQLPVPMAIGVLTRVGDNAGTVAQYLMANAAGNPVNLFLREAGAASPNTWAAGFNGSVDQLTSSSTPGADGLNRLIVMQGSVSPAARQLYFCTEGGTPSLQAQNTVAIPTQASQLLTFGARADLEATRFFEEEAARLFIAKRFLIPAEMAAIAAGHPPLQVLGPDVLQDSWLFESAPTSAPNEIAGRPAMTRAGIGWPTAPSAPFNTSLPTISGTPTVGQTLTASPGGWDGNPSPTFTYQWLRNGVAITSPAPAVNQSYLLVTADIGTNTISVRVTATNSEAPGGVTATSSPVTVSAAGSVGPIPAIFLAGSNASPQNFDFVEPLDPAYPASIAAGDFLLALLAAYGSDISAGTWDAPAGYTNIGSPPYDRTGALIESRLWARYKAAVGDETGNLTLTLGGLLDENGAIGRLTGVNMSSPIEGLDVAFADASPQTVPTITSLGPNRRAIFILAHGESATPASALTGGSGGDAAPTLQGWISTTTGADRFLGVYTCGMTSAGTVSGWQQAATFPAGHAVFLGFFVKPTGS